MKLRIALMALALSAAPAMAQSDHAGHHGASSKAGAAENAYAEGEVRKIDKPAGKVTIKHGPLVAFDMPAMTMVFRVKDPAMLDRVKTGDSIRFKAEKIDGSFTVTEYEPAK